MLARFGLELLLFLVVTAGIYFLYVKLLHSRLFGEVVEAAKPDATDAEVADAYVAADQRAEQRASVIETQAADKLASAAKLRGRKQPSVADILSETRKKK